MNKEQQMFLNIISDHLQGRKTVPHDDVDWYQISKYANSHQLEGMVNYQLHDYLANKHEYVDISRKMETAKKACLVNYAYNVQTLDEIQNTFKMEHIRYFPVKGLDVADCYPIPIYRTMGDLDMVVFPKDKKRASKALTELGYTLLENNYGLQFGKYNVLIELDDHLLHKESLENNTRRSFFETCWEYLYVDSNGSFHLGNSFHYIYLLEHTKKHFRTRGIGFRQFIDLAVFVRKHSDLDWEWIKTQLQKINLWRFAVLAHTFINYWWGIKSPFEIESLEKAFFEEVTDYVFCSGVFGFDNINCSLFVAEANIHSDRRWGGFSHFYAVFKRTFLPYEQLIRLPYCSFVRGKKWMLPYGWLYRAFYIMMNKKDHFKKKTVSLESQEIMDNHRKLMEKWGI